MLNVSGLPDGITQSDLDQIFLGYEILTYEMRTEENGSISYFVKLRENEVTAREELDGTEHIIRGERYIIRVELLSISIRLQDKDNKKKDPKNNGK